MGRLTEADIHQIADAHKSIMFPGTPEQGYTDSGLWRFLPYVRTKDSHEDDPKKVKKPLMADDPDYIKVAFLYMLACQVLAIPKSRQMRVSWITTAFSVWHTMTAPYRHTIYQTKKEDDAFAMVSQGAKNPAAGRMDFIIQHLPKFMQDQNIVSGKGNQVGALMFSPKEYDVTGVHIPWAGSMINAIPQGAHQIRQYTPSLLVSDESAFQEEYEPSMIAARPAVAGGGKVISVSSVDAGSAFNRMVLESPGGSDPVHNVHPDVQKALDILGMEWPKGLRSWETPSGVWCLEIHYTADPAKDPARNGEDWVQDAVKGYVGGFDSSGWKTEMEIEYNAGGGDPVFPFINSRVHPIFSPAIAPEEAIARFNIFAGYDHGMDSPSAFEVWGIDQVGHAYAIWELYEPCLNVGEFVEKMKACPYWDHIQDLRCDPKIMAKDQMRAAGNASIAEQFSLLGVNFLPGRRGQDVPMALRFMSEYWDDPMAPKAYITDSCPNLQKEVMDLRWERHLSEGVAARKNNPGKIRDKNNHAWDATCYIMDTRPRLWVAPIKKRTEGTTMDDLLRKADKRERERGRPSYGISVA